MADVAIGQRWVVDAEPELGLGIVVGVDTRVLTLMFPLADCERMYAREKAPLTRIAFEVGDHVHVADGRAGTITAVHEQDGLRFYDIGNGQLVPEVSLASEIKMNQPLLRLQTGQLDAAKWFAFRRQLDRAMARTWQSQLGGLLGVRANLIPHQLYVARSACDRENVRVLLADEVGLGKTLEAGMILTRLLRFECAQRVLVLVPDALQVQWLVELIRRFNLRPDLYAGEEHDFSLGQIHLIPHSAMTADSRLAQSLTEFDMAIVDEAHHLQPGSESFGLLRELSQHCRHLVLLSATPEQLGVESHFARLQLLDPAKFESLESFLAQEETYGELNRQIRALPAGREQLIADYQLDPSLDGPQLVDRLLDCHGIGRVMFRNTRASVHGFPERKAVPHLLQEDSWEAKFEWLADFARKNPGKKILVICHAVEQVRDCEAHLWQKHGIHVALFHEDMDLIERDSAAAYFADLERGCPLLLCSEIGSEGRNFQFSHHLVCLDLPDHPDVLEQRIGRLDRIGQQQTVHVHVPFAEGSADGEKFVWYHEILQCIDRQSPAAGAVHDQYWPQLLQGEDVREQAHQALRQLETQIQQGRDALLEMNSCRQPQADELVAAIAEFERETPLALVEQASELFNFHFEETQGGAYSLIPADNMLIPSLPGIPLDGVEVTFDRAVANAREDVLFLSWDSPFITGLWEILHHSDLGSASVAFLPSRQLPPGKCLLETCFDLLIQSPQATACLPFLTDLSVRTLVLDMGEKDLSDALPEVSFEKSLAPVEKKLARKIIQSRKEVLTQWYHKAEKFADAKRAHLMQQAAGRVEAYFATEIERLEDLARRNPNVDPAEVAALHSHREKILHALQNQVQVQLSAIRLVVTTAP